MEYWLPMLGKIIIQKHSFQNTPPSTPAITSESSGMWHGQIMKDELQKCKGKFTLQIQWSDFASVNPISGYATEQHFKGMLKVAFL